MHNPLKFHFHFRDSRSHVLEWQCLPHILQDRMLVSAKYTPPTPTGTYQAEDLRSLSLCWRIVCWQTLIHTQKRREQNYLKANKVTPSTFHLCDFGPLVLPLKGEKIKGYIGGRTYLNWCFKQTTSINHSAQNISLPIKAEAWALLPLKAMWPSIKRMRALRI